MKNLKIIILFLLGVISCKSQQVYPLNASEYRTPTNSYFKDLNNELDPYVGTWKATFQEKTITLVVSKQLKRPYEAWGKNFFNDILIVKYEVKNTAGQVSQSTLSSDFSGNNPDNVIMSVATNINSNNEVNLIYGGGNCSVGSGAVKFQKINATQFYWSYYPRVTVMNDVDCPPGQDYHIYLPETENLVFTKQ